MNEPLVPVVTPPELPPPQTLVCANCHADLQGEYCAACGQRHEPHIHTVAHFAHEAVESISHADSRLWRTLWYLFSRPGFLTKEFFAGKRVSYLPPFRLYLVISVVFFIVVGLGGGGHEGDEVTVEKPRSAEDVAAMRELADQFENQTFAPMSEAQRQKLSSHLREIATTEEAKLAEQKAAAPVAGAATTPESKADAAADEDREVNIMTGEGVQNGIEDFCDGFRRSIANDKQGVTAKQRGVIRWCKRYEAQGFSALGTALVHNIPRAMFVFLPLLALFMKVMYWRPKRYYVEHLLLMVHNHAFVFMIMAAAMLIGMIPFVGDYAWILYWIVFFYMTWYIYKAMRNVYGQGRALTLGKFFLMGTVYVFAAFGVFLGTVIFSAITS